MKRILTLVVTTLLMVVSLSSCEKDMNGVGLLAIEITQENSIDYIAIKPMGHNAVIKELINPRPYNEIYLNPGNYYIRISNNVAGTITDRPVQIQENRVTTIKL